MILTVGGAAEFSDTEEGLKGIDAILKREKIKKKDIRIIYGIGDNKAANQGGYFLAQQWASDNDVPFKDGSPKWNEHGKSAVEKRNEILAENSDCMILFVKGTSTGGNSIIEVFEKYSVPIHRIEQTVPQKDPEHARKIYGGIASFLLKNSITLDTETTGLNEVTDDIVEIAVVDSKTEKVLYNSLIYTETPIHPLAFAVNNITPDMLQGKPTLKDAWKDINKIIKNKIIVASNSKFDEKMFCFGLMKFGVTPPQNLWTCLLELYRKYSCQGGKGLATSRVAEQLGIEAGTHRALTDAITQAKILNAMAEGVIPNLED
jgi:hypothetical protein